MLMTIKAQGRTPLGGRDTIEKIQQILIRLAPRYLESSLVEEDSSEKNRCRLDLSKSGELAHYVNHELSRSEENVRRWMQVLNDEMGGSFPFQRQHGSVHFVTSDNRKEIHFYFDEYRLAPSDDEFLFGNCLSVKADEPKYRGEALAERTLAAARCIFDNDFFDHGYCCPSDQYDAKNLDRTGGGVCAVGLDASKYLPGFYWGNYFGPFLCDLIGEEKLMQVPGCRSYRLQSGVLVTNELPPDCWSEPAFIENENSAMNHIGRHLFFEKGKEATGKLFS